ncbi:MAG: hypothetical protein HFJ50_08480 [Clostridia bacterium]|nr:hypothetical protein [Clostridia bacterium]
MGLLFGYSAICFSKFLGQNGHIDTIERDETRGEEAISNIKALGLDNKISVFIR